MINRTIAPVLKRLSREYPVVTITGPRQSGKTTLCRKVFPKKPYVNLENPDERSFAVSDPRGFLKLYKNGAIIDEIQRAPELASYLQPFVDQKNREGMFILTGSQQFEIADTVSQSLAGRTALIRLLPLSLHELIQSHAAVSTDMLLYKGFYPRIYDKNLNPTQALADYVETYVDRDLKKLVNVKDLGAFNTFVRLCAGRTGQLLNAQSIANDAGISHTTAGAWLSILEASYIIFLVRPFHRNIGKRLIKSPKIYFYDVGLAAYLLEIENERQLLRHPLRGNLFENMVVAEAFKFRYNSGRKGNVTFYRDSSGNEVDMLLSVGTDLVPVEIKAGETIQGEFFKGIKNFSEIFPETHGSGALVYGGTEIQPRTEFLVYPALKIHDMLAQIDKRHRN